MWLSLNNPAQLEQIVDQSLQKPVLIFKHSTRCHISAMVKDRLERHWDAISARVFPYYLDLLQYRDISGAVTERFHVHHESPQVLLISKGECIYEESHNGISVKEISLQLN